MASDVPFSFLPLGAIIQAFNIKGINIVQGFPTQELYEKHNTPYFGETIGRVANRIKGAQLDSVNGKTYPLVANNSGNTLHGGTVGWGKKLWNGPTPVGVRQIPGVEGLRGGESVQFTLTSEDGDEGFPGALDVKVTYTGGTENSGSGRQATVLGIEYEARLVGGADETVINMTNHSYFNLSGDETIAGTLVSLGSSQYLPVDGTGVPTAAGPAAFPGVEAGKAMELGAKAPAFDNCFVMTTADDGPASVPVDTRALPLKLHVAASHPGTGIHLQVLSTEPSFQFYTGDFTNVPAVGVAPARGPRSAFCCEPGRWVNAANVPEWKGMTLLKRGETYGARIVYKAWAE